MNATRTLAAATTLAIAGALPAAAATGARTDHSGILVWAFLGLCALIVMAQTLPAVVLLVEMVKGALSARRLAREAAHR